MRLPSCKHISRFLFHPPFILNQYGLSDSSCSSSHSLFISHKSRWSWIEMGSRRKLNAYYRNMLEDSYNEMTKHGHEMEYRHTRFENNNAIFSDSHTYFRKNGRFAKSCSFQSSNSNIVSKSSSKSLISIVFHNISPYSVQLARSDPMKSNPAFHPGCSNPPPSSVNVFILSSFRLPRSYPAHKHGRKIINCRIAYEKYAHPLAIPLNTSSSIVRCLVSGGMIFVAEIWECHSP